MRARDARLQWTRALGIAPPKRRKPRNLEGPLQADIVAALRGRGLMAFAIPNGGKRSLTTARRLKVEGVQAGVPDICVPMPSARTVWLEVKHGRGATSDAQDQMHARLRMLGHRVEIVRSVDEALAVFGPPARIVERGPMQQLVIDGEQP